MYRLCKNPVLALWLLSLTVFVWSPEASSNRQGYTLAQLVKATDVIVYARVSGVDPKPVLKALNPVQVLRVSIEIKSCYKRMTGRVIQDKKNMKILYLTGGSEQPVLVPGSEYVFFLEDSDIGPFPLNGLDSALLVKEGVVSTEFVEDLPKEMPFADLKERLKRLAGRFGCDD